MPIFTVRETVTTYSPYGSPIPHSSTEHYRGNDKLAAVAIYFKRYDELDLPVPPKKTPRDGITVQYTKSYGPVGYQYYSYWLRMDVEDESPSDDDA